MPVNAYPSGHYEGTGRFGFQGMNGYPVNGFYPPRPFLHWPEKDNDVIRGQVSMAYAPVEIGGQTQKFTEDLKTLYQKLQGLREGFTKELKEALESLGELSEILKVIPQESTLTICRILDRVQGVLKHQQNCQMEKYDALEQITVPFIRVQASLPNALDGAERFSQKPVGNLYQALQDSSQSLRDSTRKVQKDALLILQEIPETLILLSPAWDQTGIDRIARILRRVTGMLERQQEHQREGYIALEGSIENLEKELKEQQQVIETYQTNQNLMQVTGLPLRRIANEQVFNADTNALSDPGLADQSESLDAIHNAVRRGEMPDSQDCGPSVNVSEEKMDKTDSSAVLDRPYKGAKAISELDEFDDLSLQQKPIRAHRYERKKAKNIKGNTKAGSDELGESDSSRSIDMSQRFARQIFVSWHLSF